MIIVLTAEQRDLASCLGMTDAEYADGLRSSRAVKKAADALRRYEQAGKKLNDWTAISALQRGRWVKKATVVLDAYKVAFKEDIK